jgi:hypothetical protein
MRRSWAVWVILVLMTSCGGLRQQTQTGTTGDATTPGTASPQVDQRTVEIYASTIRALAGTERWFDPVLIDERICEDAGDPMGDGSPCGRFTDAEKTAILSAVSELPNVRFVTDGDAVTRQIFKGKIEGAGLISVGPISGAGDVVQVPGEAYCGGLCGHWMTWVVHATSSGWSVVGTTGPVSIS